MSRLQLPNNFLLPSAISRRRFVQGLTACGALTALAPFARAIGTDMQPPALLRGDTFNLEIGEAPVNFTGSPAIATAVNGSVPAPTLCWREGDTVTINVTNRLRVPSSIHWHGMILPAGMDGVPGLSFAGIAPGATFQYRFPVKQAGTFWYHGHSGFQEQTGLYGAIVIAPRVGERFPADREHVVMLSDWTDTDPVQVLANLRKMSSYYSRSEPTLPELFADARREGFAQAWRGRMMWNRMRMNPRDLADVTGSAYTFLTNGYPPAANWTGLFARGETVKLRFINASAMTYFDVRIPGLKMTVVAADGQDVEPVAIDEFRLGVAETLDVIVMPSSDRAYTIFAQAIDRSGFAAGTLAPQLGVRAEIPALDAVPTLAMADMGMDMQEMDMGGMGMSSMHHDSAQTIAIAHHYVTENGPGNTNRIVVASTALDDPGAGLRNNGRRVLTYADLHTIGGALDTRDPEREIELHLTGNMERYTWSFNGVPYAEAKPIALRYGERVRVVLVNDTMMHHPIHLHGMWSEIENSNGEFQARKHTVSVRPAQRISYCVSADALGLWAYHCHMMYHMDAGMFRTVVVA